MSEPATGPPVALRRRADLSAPALIGRDRELAALAEAVAQPPAVVTVEGEAGIGKTRLVAEVRSRPEVAGRRFLVGGCRRVREPFPLGPVIEAVRELGATSGPDSERDSLRDALSPVAGAVVPLLPELSDLLPPAPPPLGDRRAELHRLFRGLRELLQAAGPAVLVLEDLHWVDEHTIDFLQYLLADPPTGLSLVVTFRAEGTAAGVRALTARLPPLVTHARLVLAPLDAAQTGALAGAILGAEVVSSEFAAYLCERASGLPFAIEELLALLRVRGTVARRGSGWARRALAELDVPAGIRDQVLERAGHLSRPAQSVFAAAAVLQLPASVPVLLATSGLPQARALPLLAELGEAGFLVAEGAKVGFRHALAAQAAYEDIPRPQRQELHARAAAALQQLEPNRLGQVAHHLCHAGRLVEWVRAAEQAADQAVELGDEAEAARLLAGVLRQAPLDPAQRSRIAVKLARAASAVDGGGDGVAELLSQVLEQEDAGPVRGELCLFTAVLLDHTRHDMTRQRQLCLEAVEQLDPHRPDLRAWAMVCLGFPQGPAVPLAEHRQWLARASGELARVSDRGRRVQLLGKVAMVLALLGDPAWRAAANQIETLAEAGPVERREAWALYTVGLEACYAGHHERGQRLLTRALAATAEVESPVRLASVRAGQALVDYCTGRWDGLADRAARLDEQLAGFAPARTEAELVDGCLRLAHGDLAGARRRLTALLVAAEQTGSSLAGLLVGPLVRLDLARGDLAGATEVVRRALAVMESKDIWSPASRGLPAMVAAVAAGDPPAAGRLLRRVAHRLRDLDTPLAAASLPHAEGVLAAARRRWRPAADLYLTAAQRYQQRRCPYEAAQALERAATCRFSAGDPAGEQPLRDALASYQRLGARWDLDRAARLARRHGVSLPARHRGGRRGYGSGLSPREREVAELAATGQTNEEIAGRLYLSVSTVEKHVTAVLRKLGAGSRRQIRDRLAEPEQ